MTIYINPVIDFAVITNNQRYKAVQSWQYTCEARASICMSECDSMYDNEESVFDDEEYDLALDDDQYLWVPEFDDQ